MDTESHYDIFMTLMVDFSSDYLQVAHKKNKAGENPRLPTDDAFYAILNGFTEIKEAIETLELTETIIGINPPRSKKIDKDSYLKFLVGAYLQEMYILEQRLSAFGTKVARLYSTPRLPQLVQEVVYLPLKSIINARGAHVHAKRFSDEHLNVVSTLALFQRIGHELGEDLDFEFRLAQREWKNRIKNNNKATKLVVNQYFKILHSVLCRNGKIVFPATQEAIGDP